MIDRKCETCRFVEKVTGTQVAVGSVAVEGDTLYCRWGPEKYEVPSADHWCYQWMEETTESARAGQVRRMPSRDAARHPRLPALSSDAGLATRLGDATLTGDSGGSKSG